MIRTATPEDIAKFYGDVSVPAKMIVIDIGEVVGIAGLVWVGGFVEAVSWITEEGKRRPKQVLMLADALVGLIEETEEQVYARRDPDEPSSHRFLTYIGFERVADDIYAFRCVPCWRRVRHAQPRARAVPADAGRIRELASVGLAA